MSASPSRAVGRAGLVAGAVAAVALVGLSAVRSTGFAAPALAGDAGDAGDAGEWIEYPHVVRATSHVARPLTAVFTADLPADATGDERVDVRCAGACRAALPARGAREVRIEASRDDGPPAVAAVVREGGRVVLRTDARWRATLDGATERPARPVAATPRPDVGAPPAPVPWLAVALVAAACSALASSARIRALATPRVVGAAIAVAWLALLAHSSVVAPGFMGFDAEHHVHYVRLLLERGALPLPTDGVQTYQPPLYYLAAAFALAALGLDTASPAAPLVLRALAFALGGVAVAGLATATRELFAGRRAAHVAALVFAGCLPVHVAGAHAVGNEMLVAALASWAAVALVRVLRDDATRPRAAGALGALLGAAAMAKLSALVLAVPALGAVALRHAGRPRVAASALGAAALVCAPYYAWIASHYGTPFVGNWSDAVGFAWWQDPGTRTLGDWLRFGRWWSEPWLAGFASVPDGFYATLFADSLLSGEPTRWLGPPWNDGLAPAALALALVPAAVIAIGLARGARLAWREPSWVRVAFAGVGVAMAAAFVAMTLRVPSFAQAKASYWAPAMIALVAAFACGIDVVLDRLRGVLAPARAVFIGVVATWALVSVASFWSPAGSSIALRTRGERALAARSPEAALAAFERAEHAGVATERAWPLVGRCRALAQLGRDAEAAPSCAEALAREPGDADALFHSARIARREGDAARAAALLQRLRTAAPDDARAPAEWLALARATGDEALARGAAREWLRVDPGQPRAHAALVALDAARDAADAADAGDAGGTRDRASARAPQRERVSERAPERERVSERAPERERVSERAPERERVSERAPERESARGDGESP
ncbi:MAG: hypothetical protein R3E88_01930 [Myxococcota bacterium]